MEYSTEQPAKAELLDGPEKKKRQNRTCLQIYAKQLYFRYVSCMIARNNSQLVYVQKVLQCPRNGGWIPDMFDMSRRRQAGKWQSNENTTRKDPYGLLHHLQHIPWAVKHGHQVGGYILNCQNGSLVPTRSIHPQDKTLQILHSREWHQSCLR